MRLSLDVMRHRVMESRVARLGTIDGNGRPHLVPFCYALEGDTIYSSVDAKPKSTRNLKRLDNIRARADVTVLVDHYEEDWDKVWWVRLRGRGAVVEEGASFARGLECLRAKYDQYGEGDQESSVIVIDITDWLGWEPSSS